MSTASKILVVPILFAVLGCAAVSGPPRDVVVRWAASPETEVNAPGGGYTVYYSQKANFDFAEANSVAVNYVSGSATMTSATLPKLTSGTWYVKVVARSTMPNGFGFTSQSPAAETTVVVP